MTSNMVMERKVGITVLLNILESSIRERKMARVDSNGKMVVSMKETL